MDPAVLEGRHPDVVALAKLFAYDHLPPHLQAISRRCSQTAEAMLRDLPDGFQLLMGLHLLVQAKDCFVRAQVAISAEPEGGSS